MTRSQTLINFPVRRSERTLRATKNKSKSTENSKKSSKENVSDKNVLSPNKRKMDKENELVSPTKMPKSPELRPVLSPLNVRRKLLSDSSPEKHLTVPNNTPIKVVSFEPDTKSQKRLSSEVNMRLSKGTEEDNVELPVSNLDTVTLGSVEDCEAALQSPKKTLKNKPVQLTPLKSTPNKVIEYCDIPRRSPRKHDTLNFSPYKTKQENILSSPMKSPLKSPLKRCLIESPRRSPRKSVPVNGFESPSTMVSKLALDSPSSSTKVGLFKPNIAAYRKVKHSLATSTPTALVCRDKQIDELRTYLTEHIEGQKPGSLYISGPPGTGKTASLTNIMESINMKGVRKVFINCMTVRSSNEIYDLIAQALNIKATGEKEIIKAIEKLITTSKKSIVMILDEIDQLDSAHHTVLYSIFEFPALPKSSLVLIGIANSLDLTDRILPRLQCSSFKPKLMNFPPYSKADIVQIINNRIQEAGLDVQIIKPGAIQFLAAKVASVAGDVRKALDVCRRAVELSEVKVRTQSRLTPLSPSKSPRKPPVQTVDIPLIHKIFNEVYGSRVMAALTDAPQSFSMQQKILVCSFLLMLKHAKCKDITVGKLHEVFSTVCKKKNVGTVDQGEFLSMCTLLEARGMMLIKKAKDIRSSKITLRLNMEEAEQALGDKQLLSQIIEDKSSLGKLATK